jgi:hypothetical protein
MPLQITATDSISGAVFTYSATGLPNGLSINATTGAISGTPTVTGTYHPVITVTDQFGTSGSVGFTWTIVPVTGNTVTVTNPGNQTGQTGFSGSLQINATDSQSGQTFTYSTTNLPPGLSVSLSGLISGTFTTAGTYSVTVKVIDTTGAFGTTSFTWTVTTPPSNIVARVGISIPNQAFGTGCYDVSQPSQNAADSLAVSLTGRPVGGTHLKVTKKFWNAGKTAGTNGDYHTSNNFNNLASYASFGTRVICCIQPATFPGLNGTDADGTPCNFTTSSQCTSAQKAIALQEVQNIINFCNTLKSFGFTSKTARIVIFQEPQNAGRNAGTNLSPTDYGNAYRTYGPVINSSSGTDGLPFPLVVNVNYGGGGPVPNVTSYCNAALGLRGYTPTNANIIGLAIDFYTNSYYKKNSSGVYVVNKTLTSTDSNGDSISSIADAQGIGLGLHEWGCVPSTFDPGGSPYPLCTAYLNYLITFFSNRVAAGKPNLDCIWYDGQCNATGVGDLTSPLGQDTSVPSPDFRIALYQQFYDAVNGN